MRKTPIVFISLLTAVVSVPGSLFAESSSALPQAPREEQAAAEKQKDTPVYAEEHRLPRIFSEKPVSTIELE